MWLLPQPNLTRFDRSVRFATLKHTKKIKINLNETNPDAVVATAEPYKVRSKCAFRYAQAHKKIKINPNEINPDAGVAQPGQRR
jgi:hypothetical protein